MFYHSNEDVKGSETAMKKYPYYLYVYKATFNVGPDIKRTIRRAKPEETDWYMKTQVANVGGYGPKLFEYSLKKRWPENEKERKRNRLGRVLELNNGTLTCPEKS